MFGYAVTLAVFALLRSPGPAFLVVAVLGFFYFAMVTSLSTALQERLDDSVRGRVMALWIMGFGGTVGVGNLIAGRVIDATSVHRGAARQRRPSPARSSGPAYADRCRAIRQPTPAWTRALSRRPARRDPRPSPRSTGAGCDQASRGRRHGCPSRARRRPQSERHPSSGASAGAPPSTSRAPSSLDDRTPGRVPTAITSMPSSPASARDARVFGRAGVAQLGHDAEHRDPPPRRQRRRATAAPPPSTPGWRCTRR